MMLLRVSVSTAAATAAKAAYVSCFINNPNSYSILFAPYTLIKPLGINGKLLLMINCS